MALLPFINPTISENEMRECKVIFFVDPYILFEGEQVRHDNYIRVAINPFDFAIASFQNSMSMRNVYAARASEDVVRELVLRIPIVKEFIDEEDQRIKDRIKKNLSHLPTPDTKIIDTIK